MRHSLKEMSCIGTLPNHWLYSYLQKCNHSLVSLEHIFLRDRVVCHLISGQWVNSMSTVETLFPVQLIHWKVVFISLLLSKPGEGGKLSIKKKIKFSPYSSAASLDLGCSMIVLILMLRSDLNAGTHTHTHRKLIKIKCKFEGLSR